MILSTGLQYVKLDASITADYKEAYKNINYFNHDEYKNYADTDKDGLYDFEEINFNSNLVEFSNGEVQLPTYAECIAYYGNKFFYVDGGVERFLTSETISHAHASGDISSYYAQDLLDKTLVLPIQSNPDCDDSDGDELEDKLDSNPLKTDIVIDSTTSTAIMNFLYDYFGFVLPPVYTNDGEKITNKNKECAETKAYFDEMLWPYYKQIEWEKYDFAPNYESTVDQLHHAAYINWARLSYGTSGIEYFWTKTSDASSILYNLTLALYNEVTNITDTAIKSGLQMVFGNYTDDITVTGTAGQITLGLLGVDLVCDIRDVTYDVTHWEWTWSHAGQTTLDSIGLIPVIGVLKNVDEIKNLDELFTVVKNLDGMSGYFKYSDEVKEQIRLLIKSVSTADEIALIKNPDVWAKLSTQVGKRDDLVVLGKFNLDDICYLDVAKKLDATYYNNDWWGELSKICTEEEMWEINKKFLESQTSAGKTIIFSHDPNVAKVGSKWDDSPFGKELDFLENNNYKICYDTKDYGYCYAVKKG